MKKRRFRKRRLSSVFSRGSAKNNDSQGSDIMEESKQEVDNMEKETKDEAVDNRDELSSQLSSLELENAKLKAIVDEMKSKVLETEASGEGVNKADVEKRPVDYDPLGASNQNEVHQLRECVNQLTEELENSKQRVTEAEEELSEMESLRLQLKEKETELYNTKLSVEDLELQLRSVKEEFQRFRKQSESNADEYEQKVENLREQLLQSRSSRHSHSRSLLESFPENCDLPFSMQPSLTAGGMSVGEDTHSTDVECSIGQDSATDEMEEYHKKIYQLSQSLKSMGMKQKDLQRRLVEAQDERDYMKSVMEDLQQQVDASSPEASAHLRAMIHSMETEIKRLERENEFLKFRLQNQNLSVMEEKDEDGMMPASDDDASVKIRSTFLDSISQTPSRPGKRTEEGRSELSEELVDVSMDIMGELANAASGMEVGISMTCVQYAGLLAAVQKAIKQLEESKLTFQESAQSFRLLDKTLSKTLSISRCRVRVPKSEGEKRLDELLVMIKNKESGLKFMEELISDLRLDIKGRESVTLQQEVQLEYIKQQLSSSDKVISLTWEVEGLKKILEECQRELKAQRDLNEQQQQELTIQWESKQQAVAETLSQNHRVESFSQQLEHVVEAKEAAEAEKQELEETLEQTRQDTTRMNQQLHQKIKNLCKENQTLKSKLEQQKQKKQALTADQCQEIAALLKTVDAAVADAQAMVKDNLIEQKPSLLQMVTGIESNCCEWRNAASKLEEEKTELEKEIRELKDKLWLAESLKARAEQEKIGVQEILSLTSESTSAEILNLQNQMTEISDRFDQERANMKESIIQCEDRIAELQVQNESLEAEVKQAQVTGQRNLETQRERLDACRKENSNLEMRIQNYKDVISRLNRDMASCDGEIKDLNKLIEEKENACRLEKERNGTLTAQIKQVTMQFESSKQENLQLLESCSGMDALQENIQNLTDDKARLEDRWNQLKDLHEGLEKDHKDAKQQLRDMELKISDLSRERTRFEEQLIEEQQNLLEARSKWEAEISALTELQTPRDRWPYAIRTLVQKCEAIVLEAATKEREIRFEEMNAVLQESEDRQKSMATTFEEQLVECAEETRSLQETVENLHQEMKEREGKLQKEIKEMRETSEQKIHNLESELTEINFLYQNLQTESEQSIQELKTQATQRDLQLTDVQAKARELMKEKDEEITLLKRNAFTEVYSRSNPENTNAEIELTKETLHKLQEDNALLCLQVKDLTSSLEDSERTHELRNKADQVMKDELNAYKRSKKREGLDMDYVKTVLVNAFENGTLPRSSPMLSVLARLFEFSSDEMKRIKKSESASDPTQTPAYTSASGSFFSTWMRP